MSAAKALVSVDAYLHTVYQPDCDYVDGEVLERNIAEGDHARLQSRVDDRINDFLEMGVPFVWVLDYQDRRAFVATPAEGLREATDGLLRTQSPTLEIPLTEFFS